jgi:alpha-glucosidase
LRGSVCLYQGEELGLEEAQLDLAELRDPFGIAYWPEFRGRDGSRTPIPWRSDAPHAGFTTATPWLPIPREHFAASVADQDADPGSLLNEWRALMRWRKAHPALRLGTLTRISLPRPLLAFERRHGDDRLLLLYNPAPEPARVNLATLRIAQPWHIAGMRIDSGEIVLAPYGFAMATDARA